MRNFILAIALLIVGNAISQRVPIAVFKTETITPPKKITITFATTPTSVTVIPSFYRYDKKFAMSFGFDDGYLDQYQVVLPMFNGGTIIYQDGNTPNYPGLNYTDGAGNLKPFTGTFNLNMFGITNNATPTAIMNYSMLQEAYVKGFDLTNHSFDHKSTDNIGFSSDPTTKLGEIIYEIDHNYDVLKANTGIKFQNFTSPANDIEYDATALNYLNSGKLKTVCNINNPNRYPAHQFTAEYWVPKIGLGFSRDFLTWTDASVTRTSADFNVIANKLVSVGSEHAWFSFATHRVNQTESVTPPATTLRYNSFKWLMEGLESRYGATGNDSMWFSNINDVYEYLVCVRKATITKSIVGNKVEVTFDFKNVPQDFKLHSLSLLVTADANITSITYSGFDEQSSKVNYKSLGNNNALINVAYKPNYEKALFEILKATVAISKLEVSKSQADLDIAQGLVTSLRNGSFKTSLQSRINAVTVIPNSRVIQIDFGRSITGYTVPFPWNTFGMPSPGVITGSKLSNLSTTTSQVTSISIEVTAPFSNYDANVSFTAATAGLPYPFEACRDVFSVAANTVATLKLTNLDMSKVYDFSFYAARGFVGNVSQYTVKGTTVSMAHKTNITGTVQILGVTPDAGGTLNINVRGDAANIGYIGVIQLTERNP